MGAPAHDDVDIWRGVWIAIPAYNEERTIGLLARTALALCPRVIVVDDGSTDATLQQLEGLPLTLLRQP
jgi:glycosyltransferase involved in cell wall biosynthesis